MFLNIQTNDCRVYFTTMDNFTIVYSKEKMGGVRIVLYIVMRYRMYQLQE